MRLLISILFLAISVAMPLRAAELVMVEEQGCYWCGIWNRDIGPIYPKTAEGKFAPLKRIEIGEEDAYADLKTGVHYTPTFLLIEDGREVGRIEGYPGEDFFWGLLAQMLKQHTTFEGTS